MSYPVDAPFLDLARRYAALSGSFTPKMALHHISTDQPDEIATTATSLASACDIQPMGAEGQWLMRLPERRNTIATLKARGELPAAIAWRKDRGTDPETEDLLSVLLDQGPLAKSKIESAVASGADRPLLQRIVVALDRAGDAVESHELLSAARSAIAELDRSERRREIASRGFFGREEEKQTVETWIALANAEPDSRSNVQCLFVSGAPGIGKSALLEDAVARFLTQPGSLIVRLDFDRAGLDVVDQRGLTMEVARQLGEALGQEGVELLKARIAAATVPETSGRGELLKATEVPTALVHEMRRAVGDRPTLFVLDTLEILRGRGETHPQTLFFWLDQLSLNGPRRLRVLAASRGEALDCCPDRIAVRVTLTGLDDGSARKLLENLQVPVGDHSGVMGIAEGNPLKLRLGAEVVKRHGSNKLPRRTREKSVSADFLYRFLLSRIDDPQLKRLAHPGLVVRRINYEVIRDVLATTLKLGEIGDDRARALMDELASHHWLVEADLGAPGFYKHRSDMRALLLPLLYKSAPTQSAAIDRAAMRWFDKRPEPWCQVEVTYHRLQLMRTAAGAQPPPAISQGIANLLDQETLYELPKAAQDIVHTTRGERTTSFRGEALDSLQDDPKFVDEILNVIRRQDWAEGQYLVAQVVESGRINAGGLAADALRTFFWRSGRWSEARQWLRERDRLADNDEDVTDLPPELALARLEMRAEFQPRQLVKLRDLVRTSARALQVAAIGSGDNIGRQGALSFLLRRYPDCWPFMRGQSRDFDLAAVALAAWGDSNGTLELNGALAVAQTRMEALHRSFTALTTARLLAVLTPYETVVKSLAFQGNQGLLAGARDIADRVAPLKHVGDTKALPASDGDAVRQITDSGLFAEWVGAASWQNRDPNLTLIARSAERWRRTMAGDWRYLSHPTEWTRNTGRKAHLWDQTTQTRIIALLEDSDPWNASLEAIDEWWIRRVPDALNTDSEFLTRLLKRFGLVSLKPQFTPERERAENAAIALLKRNVPSAFIAPLAVLLSAQRPKEFSTPKKGVP